MAFNKTQPLSDRIEKLRNEIDALIEAHAEKAAADCPGVPVNIVRQTLENQALREYLKTQDDEAAFCQCNAFMALSHRGAL